MSISPALGVEAARVLLTPDSVQMLSKLPGSRFAFLGGYDVLSEAMEAPVSFNLVQDLLLGQPLMLQDDDIFFSKVDGDRYVLLSKYDRNVRKLVGADDKTFVPGDSLAIVAKEKKAERLLEKAERKAEKKDDAADRLLVKRYWLDGFTFDPVKDVIDDLLQFRTVTVIRQEFEDTEELAERRGADVGAVGVAEVDEHRLAGQVGQVRPRVEGLLDGRELAVGAAHGPGDLGGRGGGEEEEPDQRAVEGGGHLDSVSHDLSGVVR